MAPWLEHDRMADNLLDISLGCTGPECGPQIDFIITQEAEMQPPIRGEPHPVACRTEWVGHCADKAELPTRTDDP